MTGRHKLLERQLKRHLPDELREDPRLAALFSAFDAALHDADRDRARLEHAMDISSKELEEANTELQSVLQALPERVVILGRSGRVVSIKSDPLPGLGLGVGADPLESLLGSAMLSDAIDAARHGGCPDSIEVEVDVKGERRAFSAYARSAGGDRVVLVVRDETQSLRTRAAETELAATERAARLKGEFLASMSHEIRSPMNAVIGMTSLLSRTRLNEEQRELVSTVRTSGEALVALINDILDFSKIESGQLDLSLQDFPIDRLCEDTIELLAPRARAKGVELEAILEVEVGQTVRADPSRLRQVLVNLVDNAVKFTSHGHVALRVRPERRGDSVRISVEDSGIGIDLASRKKILEPFRQADGSTTRDFGGTGLGLSISSRLLQMMGAGLSVESAADVGSTFSFRLPLGGARNAVSPRGRDERRVHVCIAGPLRAHAASQQLRRSGLDPRPIATPGLRQALLEADAAARFVVDLTRPDASTIVALRDCAKDRPLGPRVAVLIDPGASLPDVLDGLPHLHKVRTPIRQQALAHVFEQAAPTQPETVRIHEPDLRVKDVTVLVAEDNPVNQLVARRMLEKIGAEYELAGNGEEALEALERRSFDLVLMDCQMPVMDGYEATRELRRREAATGQRIPVIALTANAMLGDREACMEAGMDGYVSKPIDVEALHGLIAQHCREEARGPVRALGA